MFLHNCNRFSFVLLTIGAWLSDPVIAAQRIETHFAPSENLEHVDARLLSGARRSIDIAAYVLTDFPVIEALIAAQQRGVAVRLLLDPSQRHAADKIAPLAGVTRTKKPGPIMHLKAYVIDGQVLRTGSANFTASGLKQQDNDLVLIEDAAVVAAFTANFERAWGAAIPSASSASALPTPLLAPAPKTTVNAATVVQAERCQIKGNVNRKGEKIYHEPGQMDYEKIAMEGHPEKRWFCSGAEAEAAGWRRALR